MKKQILVNIINECIEEIIKESNCGCDKPCKCLAAPQKSKSLKETGDLATRLKTQAVLKKYPYADDDIVEAYVNEHPNGVTLQQFEIDAKKNKWSTDNIKAIASIMAKLKK